MMSSRVFACMIFVAACVAALAADASAQGQGDERIVVPLTDPSRPAILTVTTIAGNIVVRGANRKDVMVRSLEGRRGTSRRSQVEPPPGMKRLTPDAGFSVEERNNEVSVEGSPCPGVPDPDRNPRRRGSSFLPSPPKGPCGPMLSNIDFEIEVPLETNLELSTMMGSVSVNSVDGVLEINSVNGGVSLTNVAGSVVAHSVNGDVTALLTRAEAGAPMAFTTLNGDVDVTLPSTTKANLKLRTDNGDMFTDFDIPAASSRPAPGTSRQGDGRFRFEVERAILTSLNGGGPDIELRSFNGRIYLRRGK